MMRITGEAKSNVHFFGGNEKSPAEPGFQEQKISLELRVRLLEFADLVVHGNVHEHIGILVV
jgi:hypothetical protein